jgi:hypothetical protein
LAATDIQELRQEGWEVHRLIGGYIRFLRSRLDKDPSRMNEMPLRDYVDDSAADPFNYSTVQLFNLSDFSE